MQHLDLLRSQYPSATPHTIQVKHHATFQSWFANQILKQMRMMHMISNGMVLHPLEKLPDCEMRRKLNALNDGYGNGANLSNTSSDSFVAPVVQNGMASLSLSAEEVARLKQILCQHSSASTSTSAEVHTNAVTTTPITKPAMSFSGPVITEDDWYSIPSQSHQA
ncbi:hypothetical protein LINPERPRIM_LOCUS38996 [Linum perenne]